jgi:glycosyltransferase involved in cell wall biosynthesis
VSVIIPCYNVSEYVERAIQSILGQTYANLEVLIINDASTDDTLDKIKKFNDERIRLFEFEKNTQKIGAVNMVLKQAKGSFIAFQDADDWSEPHRIQEQLAEFTHNPHLGICFTNYRVAGKTPFVPSRIAITDPELKDEFLEFGHKKNVSFFATNCPSMMITSEVLKRTGGYHPYFAGRVAEDIQWIYRILKEFQGITIDKVLYNYSVREGSFTQIQSAGKNAKYAYSWQLLSKIIYKDVHDNIDMLTSENEIELKEMELEACEEALIGALQSSRSLQSDYEKSNSYKLGKFLLSPFKILKRLEQ